VTNDPPAPGFVVAWLYRPRPHAVDEFERAYGSEGPWAELFRRNTEYLGTELYRDGDTYLVLDRWRSQDGLDRFQQAFGGEYAALSADTEGLYREETKLGAFVRVPDR
jgi:heme-degrading monooxygenase HmoA